MDAEGAGAAVEGAAAGVVAAGLTVVAAGAVVVVDEEQDTRTRLRITTITNSTLTCFCTSFSQIIILQDQYTTISKVL